jgi:hypothetical protein
VALSIEPQKHYASRSAHGIDVIAEEEVRKNPIVWEERF